jgi:hypothetical protein
MDKRLTDALAFANYRLTLQTQRLNINARVDAVSLLNYNNAIFKATQALIGYVSAHISYTKKTPFLLYVDDTLGNSSLIEAPDDFIIKLIETYTKAQELKWSEQQKLKKARATKTIVGAV